MKTVLIAAAIVAISGCGKESAGSLEKASASKQENPIVEVKPKEEPKPPTKWEGPLGVKKGLTKQELKQAGVDLILIDGFIYSSPEAPAKNSAFSKYIYFVTDAAGLCRVIGETEVMDVNDFGSQARSRFDDLEKALTEKYGKSKSYKFVRAGSIWKSDSEFMMGLTKKERYHATTWSKEDGSTLPEGINSILLDITSNGYQKATVNLNYEFDNIEDCVKESKDKQNSSL